MRRALLPFLIAAVLSPAPPAWGQAAPCPPGEQIQVASPPLTATFGSREPGVEVTQGAAILRTRAIGFRTASGSFQATCSAETRQEGEGWVRRLETTDPDGREILLRVAPAGDGRLQVAAEVSPAAGVLATTLTADVPANERHLGFGQRSNAVDQRGGTVQTIVEDGPYTPAQLPLVERSVPPWGLGRRADSSTFPMPWLMSSGGWGLLVEDAEPSRMQLTDPVTLEVDAPRLTLRVVGGPTPADVLRRLTEVTGRQPAPPAPWMLGPWFQTGAGNTSPGELGYVRRLRDADAPVSVVETHFRYLPCEPSAASRAAQPRRVSRLHARGLAVLAYANSELCAEDRERFEAAANAGALQRSPDGSPAVFTGFVGDRGPRPLGQFDFSSPAGVEAWQARVDDLGRDGLDGFMEDFGEYTPLDAVTASGLPGPAMHNLYPVLYHRAGQQWAERQGRPIVRFARSGFTGVHPYVPVVWGGDPTTTWGFDGLRSAVTQGLTMGLSGIGVWGSDIGGYFTLASEELSRELLARWIQFGAVSGVMRTKAEGVMVPRGSRPQIWQAPTRSLWRRYAKLRTQLLPYLEAAHAEYRASGLPLMRHLTLAAPGDATAVRTDDQFLLGGDLLVAPVLQRGARRRSAYLPPGDWVDLWRSATYREVDGALRLNRARILRGGRSVTVPAPLDELPLFVRRGALLPLLSADVDTLADDQGSRSIVDLGEREGTLHVLAWPAGESTARFGGGAQGTLSSTLRGRTWTLAIAAPARLDLEIEAVLPRKPCRVEVDGRPLRRGRWTYDEDQRVFRARFGATTSALSVEGC